MKAGMKEAIEKRYESLRPWLDAGCHLLPILENAKRPLLPGGYKAATRDEGQVRAWLERWPRANWAIACEASGVFVVDCDYHDAPELCGLEQLGLLSMQYASIPDTYWQATPRGGVHFFFAVDYSSYPLPSTVKRLATSIDTRGVGGYALIPPSEIDGEAYEPGNEDWRQAVRSLHPVPRWICDLLLARQREASARRAMLSVLGDRERAQSAARIVEWLARVKEGERNNALYWSACELRDLGIAQDDAERALLYACALNGLPEKEALATIASAYR